jgi:hypothetical protein
MCGRDAPSASVKSTSKNQQDKNGVPSYGADNTKQLFIFFYVLETKACRRLGPRSALQH